MFFSRNDQPDSGYTSIAAAIRLAEARSGFPVSVRRLGIYKKTPRCFFMFFSRNDQPDSGYTSIAAAIRLAEARSGFPVSVSGKEAT